MLLRIGPAKLNWYVGSVLQRSYHLALSPEVIVPEEYVQLRAAIVQLISDPNNTLTAAELVVKVATEARRPISEVQSVVLDLLNTGLAGLTPDLKLTTQLAA